MAPVQFSDILKAIVKPSIKFVAWLTLGVTEFTLCMSKVIPRKSIFVVVIEHDVDTSTTVLSHII